MFEKCHFLKKNLIIIDVCIMCTYTHIKWLYQYECSSKMTMMRYYIFTGILYNIDLNTFRILFP